MCLKRVRDGDGEVHDCISSSWHLKIAADLAPKGTWRTWLLAKAPSSYRTWRTWRMAKHMRTNVLLFLVFLAFALAIPGRAVTAFAMCLM
jgi:hypothetical protein